MRTKLLTLMLLFISVSLNAQIYFHPEFGVYRLNSSDQLRSLTFFSPDSSNEFYQIRSADENHFIARSGHGLYITSNAGESWVSSDGKSTFPYASKMIGVAGSSYFTGHVSYNPSVTYVFTGSKSLDYGHSWLPVQMKNGSFNCVCFSGDSVGYMAGYNQERFFVKSTDGGFTWNDLPGDMNPYTYIQSVFFLNDSLGWIAANGVLKTTDGGNHWTKPALGYLPIKDVYFFNQDTGWMFTEKLLIRTTDGGNNWTGLNINIGSDIMKRVVFVNKDSGYLLTDNNIYLTIDGGTRWEKMINLPVTLSGMNDMILAKDKSIWLCGNKGLILRFKDSLSLTDSTDTLPQVPDNYSLAQNFPNPFNPVTSIRFHLKSTEMVKLTVFDVLGNEITVLADGIYQEGTHTVQWHASGCSGGVYFYKMQVGSQNNLNQTKKMILLN